MLKQEQCEESGVEGAFVRGANHHEWLPELMRCVETDRISDVLNLCAETPGRIHARDGSGNTLLHFAIASGSERMTGALLALGADINAVNQRGITPLNLARILARPSLIQMLLEQGAHETLPQLEPLPCSSMGYRFPL